MDMFAAWKRLRHRIKADLWRRRGSMPGAPGSNAAKWLAVERGIRAAHQGNYGRTDAGIDERVVEYAWIFDRLKDLDSSAGPVLDAGSVMNHRVVIGLWNEVRRPPLSIVTQRYEGRAFVSNTVRYEFADLRRLPYRDDWFSIVLCISTLEHVGLDNRIYGADVESADPDKEALLAMRELLRVTAKGGTLLLSVPFGARANRGWLRVFDGEELQEIVQRSGWQLVRSRYFRARQDGWRECAGAEARDAG